VATGVHIFELGHRNLSYCFECVIFKIIVHHDF
jgi:hypothetical protein